MGLRAVLVLFCFAELASGSCLAGFQDLLDGDVRKVVAEKRGHVIGSCEVEPSMTKRLLGIAEEEAAAMEGVKQRWVAAFNLAVIECGDKDPEAVKKLQKVRAILEEPRHTYDGSELRRATIHPLDQTTREMYSDKGISTENRCMVNWDLVATYVRSKVHAHKARLLEALKGSSDQ
eukprot:TRINITY_DN14487_c0_g1_i1.p1 TRINITY_DN14487_c0_g1~~TRINITY_DN14487_c0_g1_i1.p1  ORF type:complete len:199 (+),score=25.04 TRINITY_DN14487_c0_g1_i1:71-598(+)